MCEGCLGLGMVVMGVWGCGVSLDALRVGMGDWVWHPLWLWTWMREGKVRWDRGKYERRGEDRVG